MKRSHFLGFFQYRNFLFGNMSNLFFFKLIKIFQQFFLKWSKLICENSHVYKNQRTEVLYARDWSLCSAGVGRFFENVCSAMLCSTLIFQIFCSALLYPDFSKRLLCSALKKGEQSGKAKQSKLCRPLIQTVIQSGSSRTHGNLQIP